MTHLDNALLERFTEGDLDDNTAVLVAEHLDACPHCAARAAQLEPLAMAFAHSPDPDVPVDLVAAVLAEAARPPEPVHPVSMELVVGAGLLSTAAVLMSMGSWPHLLAQVATAGRTLSAALSVGVVDPSILLPLTALTGVLTVLAIAGASNERLLDTWTGSR